MILAVTRPSTHGTRLYTESTVVICVVENVSVRRVLLPVLAIQRCLMLVFTYNLFIPEGQ